MKVKYPSLPRRLASGVLLLWLLFWLPASFVGAREVSADGTAIVSIRNEVLDETTGAAWSGVLLDQVPVEIEASDTMAAVLLRAAEQNELDIIGIEDGFITAVNGLGEGAEYPEGWHSFLNDWAHDQGIADMSVTDGDHISLEYSLGGGSDIASVWGDEDRTLAVLRPSIGTLQPQFTPGVMAYELLLPAGSDNLSLEARAANRQYQVRIYSDTVKENEIGFRTGENIPLSDLDSLTIGVGLEAWPSMSPLGEGSIYTITLATETESAASTAEGWTKQIGSSWQDAPSEGVLVDELLYIMSGDQLIALNSNNGLEMSRVDMPGTASWGTVAPVYDDGRLFVALSDGIVAAFDQKEMTALWTYTADNGGQAVSPLAVGGGVVIAAFWNGGTAGDLLALSADDGELLWQDSSAAGYYGAGALIHEGKVYVGSEAGEAETGTAVLKVYDLLEGTVLDQVEVQGSQRSSVVLTDDSLFFTTKAGYLYRVPLEADGLLGQEQMIELPGASTSTPVISADRVYVGTDSDEPFGPGYLAVFELSSLQPLYQLSVPGPLAATPVLVPESDLTQLYFTVNNELGSLYLFQDGDTEGEWREIFRPVEQQQNYSLSTPLLTAEGNILYRNDSGSWFGVNAEQAETAPTETTPTVEESTTKAATGTTVTDTGITTAAPEVTNSGQPNLLVMTLLIVVVAIAVSVMISFLRPRRKR